MREERFEIIERYLNGDLSESEKLDFESQLKQDPELKETVDLHRELNACLGGEKVHKLRKHLRVVDSKWENSSQPRVRFINRRWLSMAAALAIGILAGWFLFMPDADNPSSSEDIFAQHYEPYQMVLNRRSAPYNEQQNTTLAEAITAYQEGRYVDSGNAFSSLASQDPQNLAYPFYEAISLFETGQFGRAAEILQELLRRPKHVFTEQSHWYLAMVKIRERKMDEAMALLESIKAGQFKYQEALEIID